jgi:hypothetical protein
MAGDEPPGNDPRDNDETNNGDEEDDDDHGQNDADLTELEPRMYCGKWKNFLWARDELRKHEAEQSNLRGRLPDLIRGHIQLLEATDNVALEAWREGEGKEVMLESRDKARKLWAELQGTLEDFLYYQNAAHRWKRARVFEEFKKGRLAKKKKGLVEIPKKTADKDRRGVKRNTFSLSGETAWSDLKAMINAFDRAGTGRAPHRTGIEDALGHPTGRVVGSGMARPVPPHELRLWTPPHRRPPQGLRNVPFPSENYNLVLDREAIAERQRKVDSKPNTTDGVRHRNHLERRREELESYVSNGKSGSTPERPSTSAMYPHIDANGNVTLDSFRRIRTAEGLFISARESSHDWRTSYDYLGWVKSGHHTHFEVSEVRTIDGPPPSDDDEEDIEKEPADVSREKQAVSALPETPVAAEIDYPSEASEFTRESKKLKMILETFGEQHLFETTQWAEETTGRREWHVHMGLSPASSVDSPPHSPIDPDAIGDDSIPAHYPDTEVIPLEPKPRRKCEQDPERCRAWWTHAPDECWIVESVPARARPDKTQIPEPEDFRVPTGGRRIYDARLPDHYGMDGADEALWPKIGVRVPYEPMTFDDHKSKPAGDDEVMTRGMSLPDEGPTDTRYFTAQDGKRRRAYQVHSLAVPIIKEPQRDWGEVDAEPPPAPGGDRRGSEEDSDDEGDLFMLAYAEGSGAEEPMEN